MARAAAPAPATASVCLIHGDDDYGVKQRARQLYQQWTAELGGMDHEIIDAQVANGGEALKSLGRLREALQTLPFFGGAKAIWLQNCSFLGMDRVSQSGAVTEAVGELAQELKDFDWRNVRLLISAGDLDKRRTFYKTIEKIGTVESFAAWSRASPSAPVVATSTAKPSALSRCATANNTTGLSSTISIFAGWLMSENAERGSQSAEPVLRSAFQYVLRPKLTQAGK